MNINKIIKDCQNYDYNYIKILLKNQNNNTYYLDKEKINKLKDIILLEGNNTQKIKRYTYKNMFLDISNNQKKY